MTIAVSGVDPNPVAEQAERPLLEVRDLRVHFPVKQGLIPGRQSGSVKAVDGVDFSIKRGETLGLVGESGSGKTTVGRAILQLVRPTTGEVLFDGNDLARMKGKSLRLMRRQLGVVFQDPFGALNPRMSAGDIVGEPLIVHNVHEDRSEYRRIIEDWFERVGLSRSMTKRFPHEFSGGQRQRIGVARALVANPSFLILDEPVSALDVSIQAQIINLLQDLQDQFNLAFLFIAHDLSVVRHISTHVAVMYLGKIVEIAKSEEIYNSPLHPYTQALLSAVPVPDPELDSQRQRTILSGDIPSPLNPPTGCVFHTRCPIAIDDCNSYATELREVSTDHWVACLRTPDYGAYVV